MTVVVFSKSEILAESLKWMSKREELFHILSFSNEKKVQRVLKKYPCFFFGLWREEKKPLA